MGKKRILLSKIYFTVCNTNPNVNSAFLLIISLLIMRIAVFPGFPAV